MLKISKCFKLPRKISQAESFRFFASKGCPMFECKRPPEKSDCEIWAQIVKERNTPDVLKCKEPKDFKIYRNIFCFICVPSMIACFINVTFFEEKRRKRPKFVEFTYLRIRRKGYPWDPVRTLFHNPDYNALPTGYEVEWPEEDEYDPFNPPSK